MAARSGRKLLSKLDVIFS
ncbi:hypothetical protein SOVF_140760, partial [Spinacia oleracea]